MARLRAGSTSAVVAARADCPVLIVHRDDPVTDPIGDRTGVLVGVDGRGHAGHAIAEAFEEASRRRVPLTAATVWTPLEFGYVPPDQRELALSTSSTAVPLSEQLAGYRDRNPDVALQRSCSPGNLNQGWSTCPATTRCWWWPDTPKDTTDNATLAPPPAASSRRRTARSWSPPPAGQHR